MVFASRVARLPLLDADGTAVGRMDDVVVGSRGPSIAPTVRGFVVTVQRRQIFVSANRVRELDASGVRMHTNAVDLRHFQLRPGEVLALGNLVGRTVGREVVSDLAIARAGDDNEGPRWEVSSLLLVPRGILRLRRAGRTVAWGALPGLWETPDSAAVPGLWDLHPVELAARVSRLSPERRQKVAELLDDEDLADMLAELPDADAGLLLQRLDPERAADVLEEMDADDAADVLGELTAIVRERLLATMEPDEALSLRRLLNYERDTAGGLMNPAPQIFSPEATVAEALARVRNPDVLAVEAAQIFVVEPPLLTPTGKYLGFVSFQRLLREPPGTPVGRCVEHTPAPIGPNVAGASVARRLAAYDALALPVCDTDGRLLGAVSVDDVLDRLLPEGWRSAVR